MHDELMLQRKDSFFFFFSFAFKTANSCWPVVAASLAAGFDDMVFWSRSRLFGPKNVSLVFSLLLVSHNACRNLFKYLVRARREKLERRCEGSCLLGLMNRRLHV